MGTAKHQPGAGKEVPQVESLKESLLQRGRAEKTPPRLMRWRHRECLSVSRLL